MDILAIFQSPLFKSVFWDDDTLVITMREEEGSQNLLHFADTDAQEAFLQVMEWMETARDASPVSGGGWDE